MADANSARILEVAIKALRTGVLPQVQHDDATRIQVDHITRLLRCVSARLSKRESGLRKLVDGAASLPAVSVDADSTEDLSVEELETYRLEIERQISDQLDTLLGESLEDPEPLRELERFINLEKDFYVSQDPDIAKGSQVVYRGGRIDEDEPSPDGSDSHPIDAETVTAYLCRHFARDDVEATDVRVIPGGFSKNTIFFTLHDRSDGSTRDLVMRKDMPVPFIDKTVADEFGLLQRLHGEGFPVPRPLWLETDHDVFGGKFIVFERARGSSDAAHWTSDAEHAKHACQQLAGILARLHAFSPEDLGYSAELAGLSAGEHMERDIAQWSRLFHTKKPEPMPLQELPLIWLERNIPSALYQRPAKVVHGDFGFHNMMFDDNGEISAVLDWEFSVLGDPSQDLFFVRSFVENLMDWEEFLELYLSQGGIAPCEEARFFYDMWTKTRNSIGCVDAQSLFDTVMPHEIKFALTGHVFAPYLQIDECESIVEHIKNTRP